MTYDIAVIGAGSGGLSVAAAAAQFGRKVILFEKGKMGGDCLNYGCVPSKALIAVAKHAYAISKSSLYGIHSMRSQIDFPKVMDYVQSVIAGIAPHDSVERFEGLGVKVVQHYARFVDAHTLEADSEKYTAKRIVIATGSRPAVPPIPGLDQVPYFTNETIFENRLLPKHLLVIGGGPIGMELAQAHRRLGSDVSVIEAFEPLGREDPELSKIVVEQMMSEGIGLHGRTKVTSVEKIGLNIVVHTDTYGPISGSHLLVAVGRTPNTQDLGLDAAGIASTPKGITVDHGLKTSQSHVYAIGDAAGGLQFTHVANYHAGLVIRNALFKLPVKNRTDLIPRVTYTDPEIASIGLAEAEARNLFGDGIKVLRTPFSGNDRARAEGDVRGLVKAVIGKRGKILGASIVGAQAGELIQPWILAMSQRLKIKAFTDMVAPYPTRGEASKRAAIENFAALATNPYIRKTLNILELFG
jgi:pyruvate/2-oxoglutarate dehydrogenase complex dihydrolipoamide dehydrogenase (E3) component